MLLRGLGPGRPPPPSDYLVYRDIQRKKLSHQTSEKILYLILSCIYFLRIPTKTTFISTKSWKSYQLIRGHVVFLFSFATYDVVRSWSIFVLPSIVLVNLFENNDVINHIINQRRVWFLETARTACVYLSFCIKWSHKLQI